MRTDLMLLLSSMSTKLMHNQYKSVLRLKQACYNSRISKFINYDDNDGNPKKSK